MTQIAKTKALDSMFSVNINKSRSKSKNRIRSIDNYSYKNMPTSGMTPLSNKNGHFTNPAAEVS